jgi:hypothetical protein
VDEFSILAKDVALAIGDVHACLVLSRDGMVVGAHPDGDESVAKPAWLRFAALGQSRRGFIEFADQLWVFIHRGPYAAFALAAPSVRPGLLMDQMEQALLSAEEQRSRREPRRPLEAGHLPSGKLRAPLHPQADRPAEEAPRILARAIGDEPAVEGHQQGSEHAVVLDAPELAASSADQVDEEKPRPDEPSDGVEAPPSEPHDEEGSEVDRVLLAKEFYGLLQVQDGVDEGSS